MATLRTPSGLDTRGRRLWKDLHALTTFNAAEIVILEEACRIADRLDKLDAILSGDAVELIEVHTDDGVPVRLVVDSVLSEARQQANVMKQLLAALRLPEEMTGQRPQQRGGARGAYQPSGKAGAGGGATVTSLDRARARAARGG